MDKRLSIYVSSPDSYSDVLAVFLKGYRRYWSDCPYEFILTTNTKSYEGITCICNNKQNDTWVERTIAALPVIKSKYVMLMCDDIILSDNVDNSLIERLLDYMDSHEIRYCNLGPTLKLNLFLYCVVSISKSPMLSIFNLEYFERIFLLSC